MRRSPHVDSPPQFQLFRNRTLVQAELLSSDSTCPRQGPFAPQALPRFHATMGLSDSRHGQAQVMHSLWMLRSRPAPCRVSKVPRSIFQYAPSPITPESSTVARARFFTADTGLRLSWTVGHSHQYNEAESDSLALRLTLSPCEASQNRLPCSTLAWLLVKQAIYKMNSSQFIRLTRLSLAHQDLQDLNDFSFRFAKSFKHLEFCLLWVRPLGFAA